jgi:hypothetical protein
MAQKTSASWKIPCYINRMAKTKTKKSEPAGKSARRNGGKKSLKLAQAA